MTILEPTVENMLELVRRLRARKEFWRNGATWVMLNESDTDCLQAADALEAQTHEIARLREALESAVG